MHIFDSLTLSKLKAIIRAYNLHTKIVVSKRTKAEIITEMKKHLMFNKDGKLCLVDKNLDDIKKAVNSAEVKKAVKKAKEEVKKETPKPAPKAQEKEQVKKIYELHKKIYASTNINEKDKLIKELDEISKKLGYKSFYKEFWSDIFEKVLGIKPKEKEKPKPATEAQKKEMEEVKKMFKPIPVKKEEKPKPEVKKQIKEVEKITKEMKKNKEKNKKLQTKVEKIVKKVPEKHQMLLLEDLKKVDCSHLVVKDLVGTQAEKKKQYIAQALLLHPDKNPEECKAEAEEAFRKLSGLERRDDGMIKHVKKDLMPIYKEMIQARKDKDNAKYNKLSMLYNDKIKSKYFKDVASADMVVEEFIDKEDAEVPASKKRQPREFTGEDKESANKYAKDMFDYAMKHFKPEERKEKVKMFLKKIDENKQYPAYNKTVLHHYLDPLLKEEPKKEESLDELSNKLTQKIMITPFDKIKKALVKLNFKGKMQSNKMLLSLQISQNFKTKEMIIKLLNELD